MEVSCQLEAPVALPPGTHWIGSWEGSRAGLDAIPLRESNRGHTARRLITPVYSMMRAALLPVPRKCQCQCQYVNRSARQLFSASEIQSATTAVVRYAF